jgi:hypothetical protein
MFHYKDWWLPDPDALGDGPRPGDEDNQDPIGDGD